MNLSGYKWGDANDNGLWDEPNEAGLTGWTIIIDTDEDPTNGYLLAELTDENGKYEFTGLNPFTSVEDGTGILDDVLGNYTGQTLYVYEVQQDGFTQTYGGYTFEITSGFGVSGSLGETEEGNFGNSMLCGANRTPGFWQSTLGQSFYDGILDNQGDSNGPDQGGDGSNKDFEAEGWSHQDLLELYGVNLDPSDDDPNDNKSDNDHFVLWDPNNSGTPDQEGDIFLTPAELLFWVSGGPKGGNDFLSILERDVAATFLNTLNNDVICGDGEKPAGLDPLIAEFYEDAITFINKWDKNHDGRADGGKKQDQKSDWNAYGSEAHTNLGAYNESGEATVDGVMIQIAMDGDDYSSPLVQNYLATMEKIGVEGMHEAAMLPPEDVSLLTQTLQVA